jgi:Protein of unknown function (DUF1761)
MVVLMWLLPCLITVAFVLILPALWRREIYRRYSGGRPVSCPVDQKPAVVGIDLQRAAEAEMDGRQDLRLAECTCWPERAQCNQACLAEAIQAQPYKQAEVKAGKKQIYHLPVLLAAFAAWCVGAIWHAQYVFRPRWMAAAGLSGAQVHEFIGWYSLHLLTLAMCVLFAYGVAWLLAVSHRKGVAAGLLMAVLLCAALLAACGYAIVRMPHELLVIESGYIALATLLVGAIVGGFYDKLVLQAQ